MNDELKRFFNSIEFYPEEKWFANASVLKVIYMKKLDSFEVHIENEKVIPWEIINDLFRLCHRLKT